MGVYFDDAVAVLDIAPEMERGVESKFWRQDDPVLNENRQVLRGGMWDYQRRWWNAPEFVKLLLTGLGGGKCGRGNIEVYDPVAGMRRRVKQLGKLDCVSLVEDNKLLPRQAEAIFSGRKSCVRVTVSDGSTLDVTADHPILTVEGWVEAGRLERGAWVTVPRRLPVANTVSDSDDVIKFAAYMLADGGTTGENCTFYKALEDILDDFEAVVKRLGGESTRHPFKGGCHKVAIRKLRPLLHELGIQGHKSKDKRIPARWYGMNKSQAVIFLRAFLACDAHFSIRSIDLTLASPGLIKDVRHLYLLLGIQSRVKHRRIKLNRKVYPAVRLMVHGAGYRKLLKLLGDVPGRMDRIQTAKDYFASIGKGNPNHDIIPFGRRDVAAFCRRHGLGSMKVREVLGGSHHSNYSRQKMRQFFKLYPHVDDPHLRALVYGDVGWSKVESVEPIGKFRVYDLSVNDSSHNYVANQVVIHNTQVGAKRIISLALHNAPAPVAYVAPTFALARNTGIVTIQALLQGKQPHYGRQFWWKYNKTAHEFRLRYRGRDATIIVYSGDDPFSLRGPNLAAVWMDEPFIMDQSVFEQMIARVRHPAAVHKELNLTGTPEGLGWGYDLCLGELGDKLKKSGYGVGLVQGSTRGNLVLDPGYVQRLEGVLTEQAAKAYIDGQLVSLSTGLVYYAFSGIQGENVADLPLPPGAELGCGMDFNVNPFAATIFWRAGSHMHFFDEYELENSDTEYMCQVLREGYVDYDPAHPERRKVPLEYTLRTIYPDATGAARKTAAPQGKSDFWYIRQAGFDIEAPPSNPKVKDRENAVNGKFRPKLGKPTLTISPKCKKLIKYLSTHSHADRNKQKEMTHLLDALGYPIFRLFPVSGEVLTQARLGGF